MLFWRNRLLLSFSPQNSKLQCSLWVFFSLLQNAEYRDRVCFPLLSPSLSGLEEVGTILWSALQSCNYCRDPHFHIKKSIFCAIKFAYRKLVFLNKYFQPYNSETLKRLKKKVIDKESEYTYCLLNSTEQRIFSGLVIS